MVSLDFLKISQEFQLKTDGVHKKITKEEVPRRIVEKNLDRNPHRNYQRNFLS